MRAVVLLTLLFVCAHLDDDAHARSLVHKLMAAPVGAALGALDPRIAGISDAEDLMHVTNCSEQVILMHNKFLATNFKWTACKSLGGQELEPIVFDYGKIDDYKVTRARTRDRNKHRAATGMKLLIYCSRRLYTMRDMITGTF
jgi:hypothetical protein